MNRRNLGGLIVLNLVLLVTLGLLSFTPVPPAAEAQIGGRGGDYIMISGQTPGQEHDMVYVTDVSNGAILAVTYQQGRRALTPVAVRSITGDFDAAPRR